jgi:SAM-dependent methyltransferase
MNDWTAGYVADIGYTFGYYAELNPLRARLAFLDAGLAAPTVKTACELGFGQGLSVNIHAAASAVEWHGTDFNPAHAGLAQELAAVSGARARLHDEAFAEFCSRSDLPEFDFIGVHGIWSWISDENRRAIVDFIRRRLKVGGVLYVSYNTFPGWAAAAPLRHLMVEHAEVMAAPGRGIVSRIAAAVEFAEKLLTANPAYARANPQVAARLAGIKAQKPNYLAHEYFNRDWQPMHFAEMAEWLSPARLSYACSAHLLDHVEQVNLSSEQWAFLEEIPDPMFRATVRDFMVNQQFRRDYWVKGARPLSALERIEQLRDLSVILTTPRADVSLKVAGALGEATMQESAHAPILDVLAGHRPTTLGEIERKLPRDGGGFGQVLQTALLLTGKGDLNLAQDDEGASRARLHTDRLNAHLMRKARSSGDIAHLASPVTGGGVEAPRFHQLFLGSMARGRTKPDEWAADVWEVFAAQGQRIVRRDGRTLETAEENVAELAADARQMAERRLPALKALQIA